MAKFRANTTACREREAVCFGGLASPHFSIYKRELARKERSRSRKALTVALALATAALFSACVGCVVYLLRDSGTVGSLSGTVLGMGGESESGADSVGEMLVRARETAKKERIASGDEVSEGTSELRIEGLTGIDFVTVTSAWSKIYNIPRGTAGRCLQSDRRRSNGGRRCRYLDKRYKCFRDQRSIYGSLGD